MPSINVNLLLQIYTQAIFDKGLTSITEDKLLNCLKSSKQAKIIFIQIEDEVWNTLLNKMITDNRCSVATKSYFKSMLAERINR